MRCVPININRRTSAIERLQTTFSKRWSAAASPRSNGRRIRRGNGPAQWPDSCGERAADLEARGAARYKPCHVIRFETWVLASRVPIKHDGFMKKNDVTCPDCRAGFRRIELSSRQGARGEYRCLICDTLLEVFDGSTEVAYRLTVQSARKRGTSSTPYSHLRGTKQSSRTN